MIIVYLVKANKLFYTKKGWDITKYQTPPGTEYRHIINLTSI
jgi:hypothetical protein